MKLVILMPVAEQRGGAELMLMSLLKELKTTRGLKKERLEPIEWMVVFLEGGPMVKQTRELGSRVRVFRAGRGRDVLRFVGTTLRLIVLLRREKPDVVFSWMTKAQPYGALAAAAVRAKTVWFEQGTPQKKANREERLAALLGSCGILVWSRSSARAQRQLTPHIPLRIVHPGIEADRFDADALPSALALREQLGLPTAGPIVGIVGRLQHWKGMHVLVEAMPQILQSHPDAHCVIVGGEHSLEPDYPAFLHAKVEELGLQKCVIIAGFQTNVPAWMGAMDVVVHASDAEPFGIVVLEAMALGKPVVAGQEGGPLEVITPEVDGLLSPFGDAPALARCVLRYLDDPVWARQIGDAAQQSVAAFTTQRFARNVIAAVTELLPSASHGRVN